MTPKPDVGVRRSARSTLPDSAISTSAIVTDVFDTILDEIKVGVLRPGDHISDMKLAERFGVSRTPVREAIQRLREIGVIEAAANRFTRVTIVEPIETVHAMTVWLALFTAVVDEVITDAHDELVTELEKDRDAFLAAVADEDWVRVASANFAFFQRIVDLSANPHLRRSVRGVVHVLQLGSLHLPEPIDGDSLAHAQQLMIDAARSKDRELGYEALRMIGSIRVPVEEPAAH